MNRKLWIIVKEVYRKNVKSPAFFFMVFGPLIMFAIIGVVAYFIAQDQIASSKGDVAIVHATPEIQQVIVSSPDSNTYHFEFADEESAQRALAEGTVDGYLVLNAQEESISGTYYRENTGKEISLSELQSTLTHYLQNNKLEALGLTSSQLQYVQTNPINVNTVKLELTEDGQVKESKPEDWTFFVNKGVAYTMAIIVFMFIMNYVSLIAQEIATEKGSRIMEIILSSVSATTHFFGKMLGISLVILTQFVIYYLLGLGLYHALIHFNGWSLLPAAIEITEDLVKQVLAMAGHTIWLSMAYAVIGIITYSCIAGFLGSLVTKVEDVQKVITPIVLFAILGFYIGMYATASTNNPIVRIGSHIPLLTPFVMPHRIAAETVGDVEIWLSFIVSIVFAIVCLFVSTVLYRGSVLVYSDKGVIKKIQQSYQVFKDTRPLKQKN